MNEIQIYELFIHSPITSESPFVLIVVTPLSQVGRGKVECSQDGLTKPHICFPVPSQVPVVQLQFRCLCLFSVLHIFEDRPCFITLNYFTFIQGPFTACFMVWALSIVEDHIVTCKCYNVVSWNLTDGCLIDSHATSPILLLTQSNSTYHYLLCPVQNFYHVEKTNGSNMGNQPYVHPKTVH